MMKRGVMWIDRFEKKIDQISKRSNRINLSDPQWIKNIILTLYVLSFFTKGEFRNDYYRSDFKFGFMFCKSKGIENKSIDPTV